MKQKDKESQEFWSRRYGRPVSEEEVREIAYNLSTFFGILDEAERKLNEVNVGVKNGQADNHGN